MSLAPSEPQRLRLVPRAAAPKICLNGDAMRSGRCRFAQMMQDHACCQG
jgi:hypothetical protein